jgi:transposase
MVVPDSYIFQHDNDPKHTAKATTSFLQDQDIEVLSLPSQSADLNPIEHIWNYLKVHIGKRGTRSTSIHDLWEIILEE